MKYCVITQIFDNYDLVREPEVIGSNCDYFLFTDNKDLTSEKWNVIYLENFDTNKLNGRQKTTSFKFQCYKYIPNFQDYDYIIRIDASMQLYSSMYSFVNYMKTNKYDLAVVLHGYMNNKDRNSSNDITESYRYWISERGMSVDMYKIFVKACAENNFDIDLLYSLTANGLQIYKNTEEVLNLLDDTYSIINYYTNCCDLNDQCYFCIALRNYINKLRILYLPVNVFDSEYITLHMHNKKNKEFKWRFDSISSKSYKFLGKYITSTDIKEFEKYK